MSPRILPDSSYVSRATTHPQSGLTKKLNTAYFQSGVLVLGGASSLGVWSQGLMVRSVLWNGRKHYGTSSSRERHDPLRIHLGDFMAAYNFARRLQTLSGLTPYEYICKIWASEPDRFIVNSIHQMPGLNT
jgi:hypothetical protein